MAQEITTAGEKRIEGMTQQDIETAIEINREQVQGLRERFQQGDPSAQQDLSTRMKQIARLQELLKQF